jgi:hypothetical protein
MSNMSGAAAKLPKHHYIPVFYLKQWRDSTKRVIEFSRPYKSIVKTRNVDPDGTGYVRGLYRMPGVADEHAEIIEQTFFKRVDDQAAIALQKLLKTDLMGWSLELRKSWTLFLLSLFMRSPKIVADALAAITDGLPAEWAEIQRKWEIDKPEEPPLEDYNSIIGQQYSLLALRRFIANDEIGLLLLNMVAGTNVGPVEDAIPARHIRPPRRHDQRAWVHHQPYRAAVKSDDAVRGCQYPGNDG